MKISLNWLKSYIDLPFLKTTELASLLTQRGLEVAQIKKDGLDEILDIEITPNRADACSHLGVARELKAILHLPIMLPSVDAFRTRPLPLPFEINVVDTTLCPRYSGLLLKNVVIQPSPQWLCDRLECIGVKSINNVVDVTNFVLHELGQPLHAFDYDTIISKQIMVTPCAAGEMFIGLDGIERKLTGHELMISDIVGPIAMAGILGGLRTSVTSSTRHIFIESAYFNPAAIRYASQYHNLKTDAAFRFERGTDPNMPLYALKRAALLLQQLIPSAEAFEIIDLYPAPVAHYTIPISYAEIMKCLGIAIHPTIIKQIVTDLEIGIEEETGGGFTAKVPPYRVDVTRAVDLIEEIARIYGYDEVYATGHLATGYLAPANSVDNTYKIEQEIGKLLVANGYYEIWTNSLIKGVYVNLLEEIPRNKISILNPPSASVNTLRYTLLFSGLEVIAYNLTRRQHNLRLFEFGTVYSQDGVQYKETKKLAIWLTGQIEPNNWVRQLGSVTLQNLRTTIEKLVQKLGIDHLSYGEIVHPFYEQAAQVTHQGKKIMTFGQVRSSILSYCSVKQPIYFADINWAHMLSISRLHRLYEPISKFPAVKRDLSVVVDKSVLFQNVQDCVLQQAHKNILEISLFDVYEGAPLPIDKKSYAVSCTLQDKEKTLDEKSIDQIMNQLVQTLERNLKAIIRD